MSPTTPQSEAVEQLEALGADVDWDVSLPTSRAALAVYYVLAPSECSANLARYDGVKYGYADQGERSLMAALEATLLRTAHAYEQATGWHDVHPAL